jgi:hypothetical protein
VFVLTLDIVNFYLLTRSLFCFVLVPKELARGQLADSQATSDVLRGQLMERDATIESLRRAVTHLEQRLRLDSSSLILCYLSIRS